MIKDLTDSQKVLALYMSELSEEAYYAGWMHNLEHALWAAVIGGPREYGRLQITNEHINNLKSLSSDCNGWIIFDDLDEEKWVSIAEWKTLYDTNY
jgi:hypothetical protein